MKYWMKMIGTSGNPCDKGYTRNYVDFARNPRKMRCGDFLVLYAVGGSKCVFAQAQVTSDVFATGEERWPYRVYIRYIDNLPISGGVHIEEISIPTKRDLLRAIPRAGYFELQPEEYERARTELHKRSFAQLEQRLADLENRVANAARRYFDEYEAAIKQAAPKACKEPLTVREEEEEEGGGVYWIAKGKGWSMYLSYDEDEGDWYLVSLIVKGKNITTKKPG